MDRLMRRKALLLMIPLGLALLVAAGFFFGKPTPFQQGYERVEVGLSVAGVTELLGPWQLCSPSQPVPDWADPERLYAGTTEACIFPWTDGSDTVLVVFSENRRVLKKAFYPGRRGIRDYRPTLFERFKEFVGL